MKEASHQKIQIYPVKPIVDSNNEDDVRHFEHSRSFKKDESETESKNSIEQRWVERRIFTTTDSFPSISTSNRIVNVKSIILRPVSPTWCYLIYNFQRSYEVIRGNSRSFYIFQGANCRNSIRK